MASRRSSRSPSVIAVLASIACLALFSASGRAEAKGDRQRPQVDASLQADSPERTKAVKAWPTSSAAAGREEWPLVVIDPGHGGARLGTVSADGVAEKVIVLEMARRLERALAGAPVRVRLTRTKDVHLDLKDRIELANAERAALFISIHLNAMPAPGHRRTRGVETYFLAKHASGERAEAVAAAENAEDDTGDVPRDDLSFILADLAETEAHRDASQLAYTVHENLISRLKARDRGVHQAPFRVLKGARMPAILVEVGYLSHPQESRRLRERGYQGRIAEALARGIVEFLDERGLIDRPPQASLDDGAAPRSAQREVEAGP